MRCLGVLLVALLASGFAQGDDLALALKEGDRQLAALTALADNLNEIDYFEVRLGEEAVGYGERHLKAVQRDGKTVFAFGHKIVVRLPNQVGLTVFMAALLQPNLKPIEVSVDQAMTSPTGPGVASTLSAKLQENQIVISKEEGNKTTTTRVPVPRDEFVFAIDCVIEQIARQQKLRQKKDFALRQFDMETGETVAVHCKWARNDDGDLQLDLHRDGDSLDEYFVFDGQSALKSYGKIDPPFVEVKVTPQKLAGVKQKLGL